MHDNKILVALDGSKKALKTIDYLCSFKPFHKFELVLHNIITRVPECYYDLKKDPISSNAISQVEAWKNGYRIDMEAFMEEAKMKLIASGFKPERINIRIKERKDGIARDILDEAQKGYYALLVRRRGGVETLLSIAMGSVSTKLVEKATAFPVLLAGVQGVTNSIFIAIDGSDGSRRAVDFASKTIGDSDCKIVLCSVLRDFNVFADRKITKKSNKFTRNAFMNIETAIKDAEQTLETAGIKKSNIMAKIIQGAQSRSAALVETAKEENCDTIVLGRKGKSEVGDFDIGRIPWKITHGARQLSVWLVP